MWQPGGRAALAETVGRQWDVLVIGGGITGAGILLEAARRGLSALLVEQRDFAWGTSSRSSKLVHGGLRYLKEGKFGLTRESVQEREALLRDAAGLVVPQSFAFGDYPGRKPGRTAFLIGLALYDLMAGKRSRQRHYVDRDAFLGLAPNIDGEGLRGGMCYTDAKTDDARLVMRVLQEAQAEGGVAVNYMSVQSLLRDGAAVKGATVRDELSGAQYAVNARVVISATGAWADRLRAPSAAHPAKEHSNPLRDGVAAPGHKPGAVHGQRLRPLRGSHLVLPHWRLPLAQAVSLMHPVDGRPVFAFPWEGVTLVGTTDVDHRDDLSFEAAITRAEVEYLMAALRSQFPQQNLNETDIVATYAGVRPVIDSGQADPSKETREHALWLEDGLLTVTGGKLTTFRVIALDALRKAAPLLPQWKASLEARPVFAAPMRLPHVAGLPAGQGERLPGRYGALAGDVVACAQEGELAEIPGTASIWAQLRWAARHESVQRLDDLLLRRLRIGLQLRGGGEAILPRVRAICQPELGWSDARWDAEQAAYLALWRKHYSIP
ncbi:FAD-dependent oxidoreductase [Duganella ginsengisoli]|uniref:FAD-dependent oxidoreductase n=1 Tax=Pseudoduganella ginsengisoli TaxID=1462440 RepID=A0A6L6PYR5_9BURK|nr:glycerol-3-phosphate dehydrogenase/oxidase [Pseudoduganella ginsengisoli]MTW02309.1 FAD-dependent oxidoreductase [Pseudoduganella ginsengisoli]